MAQIVVLVDQEISVQVEIDGLQAGDEQIVMTCSGYSRDSRSTKKRRPSIDRSAMELRYLQKKMKPEIHREHPDPGFRAHGRKGTAGRREERQAIYDEIDAPACHKGEMLRAPDQDRERRRKTQQFKPQQFVRRRGCGLVRHCAELHAGSLRNEGQWQQTDFNGRESTIPSYKRQNA